MGGRLEMCVLKPKACFLKNQGTGTEIDLGISIKLLENLFYSNVLCDLMMFLYLSTFWMLTNASPNLYCKGGTEALLKGCFGVIAQTV